MSFWPFASAASKKEAFRVERFVATLMRDPAPDDVAWLTSVAAGGDDDRARWELRYAQRALGLIVAQRDALDDRTASLVSRALTTAMASDRNVAAERVRLAERQFNERLGSYRDMLQLRGSGADMLSRLARALLMLAGAPRVTPETLERASTIVGRMLDEANAELRTAFGEASLPANTKPSSL